MPLADRASAKDGMPIVGRASAYDGFPAAGRALADRAIAAAGQGPTAGCGPRVVSRVRDLRDNR
jgi:hypothetical protein